MAIKTGNGLKRYLKIISEDYGTIVWYFKTLPRTLSMPTKRANIFVTTQYFMPQLQFLPLKKMEKCKKNSEI